jgi:hypothetical protein
MIAKHYPAGYGPLLDAVGFREQRCQIFMVESWCVSMSIRPALGRYWLIMASGSTSYGSPRSSARFPGGRRRATAEPSGPIRKIRLRPK